MKKKILSQVSIKAGPSQGPGGHVVLGGDNVPPLVEIGLTDLPKTGGAYAPHRAKFAKKVHKFARIGL